MSEKSDEIVSFTRIFPKGCGSLTNTSRITGFCDVVRDFPRGCGPNATKIAPVYGTGLGLGSSLSSGFNGVVIREGLGGKIRSGLIREGLNMLKGPSNSAVKREGLGGKIRQQPYPSALKGAASGKVRYYDPSDLKGPGLMSGKVRQYEPSVLKGPGSSGGVRQYEPSALKKPSLNESKEREKVLEMLELFRKRCDDLLRNGGTKRVDIVSNRQLSQEGKIMKQPSLMFGSIPGVEVGDKFYYRIELVIVGLHRLFQGGIDSMEYGGDRFATCIVANEGHLDKMGDPNVLCYLGEGGNLKKHEVGVPPDQVLTGGNLALNNSRKSKRPVRVVRGLRYGAGNVKIVYVYDGLYLVSETVKKKGPQRNFVFEFQMSRDSGQPDVPWKELRRLFH